MEMSSSTTTIILTPRYCTKRISWIKKRLGDSPTSQLGLYERQLLELRRTFNNPDKKSKCKLIFEGIPCHRCRKLITVGSEFLSRGRRSTKAYHVTCAKDVHLI